MTEVLETSALYGCKAATITGGGEPLLHPRINDVLRYAGAQGIETGLVTNGVLLDRLEEQDSLTWARISCSDERVHDYKTLNNAVQLNANTDWAFSYVVSKKPYYKNIEGVINFANDHNFSHVRLVSDMFDLENVPDMDHIKDKLKVDTSKVIFQGRKDSTRGQKNCYISLLKPVIAPEGIFPCCGAQYAVHGQKKALVDDMKMGEVDDLEKILQTQVPFNGEKCDVCYYSQYNDALAKMLSKPEHGAFV